MTNPNDYRHRSELRDRILPNLDTLRPHFEECDPKFQGLRRWLADRLEDPLSRSTLATRIPEARSSRIRSYVERYGSVSREDWLTALESGEYSQVHGYLTSSHVPGRKPDTGSLEYCRLLATCCLGVAPKLAALPFKVPLKELILDDPATLRWGTPSTSEAAALIEGLLEWESHLAMLMNDTLKLNFQQIAAVFRLVWNMPRTPNDR